ncbi:uncharacterized protein LOC130591855 [Beta vulgaris subsp. vulgaris]|uniref:uncharacterized protein LOC130591855 n=1 Tax=Beta vulgaris subsp. vulgaris TaxID=3555 RepID=UPI002546CB5D|nr:uncharacterized protein LOC130591855 [Beta vulgaris subsp. vulgaris]
MEGSTGRIPNEGEREVQSARPANPSPPSEHVQEEQEIGGSPAPSPSIRGTVLDEPRTASSSNPASGSEEPSTTSSEIRRRLGPLSDPRFILADNTWLGRIGSDLRPFSLAMPMPGYQFVLPGREDTILSAPSGHFAVYRLALDAGLRFPLHPFISQVLHYYGIGHNQLAPNSWQNILTFLAVCNLKGKNPSLAAFTHIHYVSRVPRTFEGSWLSVCNRQGFLTSWDKTSKMHSWKGEFLFIQAPDKAVAKRLRYFSRANTNTGRMASFLELEDKSAEEMVEYFRISEYSMEKSPSRVRPTGSPLKRYSVRSKLKKSWIGDMSSSRFADNLWKEYSKSGAEKRADTLKNAPTSRALAEKAAAKKRPAGTSEAPPPKKAKGFTAKKKKSTRPAPKVVIEIPAKEEAKEEPSEIGSLALVTYAGPAEHPTASQPDEMPTAYRTASRSSDKGKGPLADGSPILSDDESSPAFGRMSSADREKLKTELFKCFPEPYIKG